MSSAHSSDALDAADAQDGALAERIRSGDAEALGELFDRHGPTALAVTAEIVAEGVLAEVVVHDAFVAVWRTIDEFDPSLNTLGSWVAAVTRKHALAHLHASIGEAR